MHTIYVVPQTAIKKNGTVQSFNVSPKGMYEGLFLQTKTELIQINFPREFAAMIADVASIGDKVKVEVEAGDAKGHASHPVYALISVQNDSQQRFSLAESIDNGNIKFAGKVERLNYALHGEVNGAILETGDFLHVKPHGAAALELVIGMKVKGIGATKPMTGGHQVIEAEEVNGIYMEHKPKPKK